jgi:hypothetical protein
MVVLLMMRGYGHRGFKYHEFRVTKLLHPLPILSAMANTP